MPCNGAFWPCCSYFSVCSFWLRIKMDLNKFNGQGKRGSVLSGKRALPIAFQEGSVLTSLWICLLLLFPLGHQVCCKTSVFPVVGEAAMFHIKPAVRAGWMLLAFANLLCHVAERPLLAPAASGMCRLVSCVIMCLALQWLPWASLISFHLVKLKFTLQHSPLLTRLRRDGQSWHDVSSSCTDDQFNCKAHV